MAKQSESGDVIVDLGEIDDTVAEWLRRSTRNRLGLSRVGSSPTSVESPFCTDFRVRT